VEVRKSDTKSSPEGGENVGEDLDSLLLQLQKHLSFESKNPSRDLQEIKDFVKEASAVLDPTALSDSCSPADGDTSRMFKDEPMPEPTITATAEDVDQRARSTDLDKLLIELVDNPAAWLSAPSVHFGGRKPRDLVGTDEEYKLVDLLQAVDQGLF